MFTPEEIVSDPDRLINTIFTGDDGGTHCENDGNTQVVEETDRIVLQFSVNSVSIETAEAIPLGDLTAEYELRPDPDDPFRTALLVRLDKIVKSHVVLVDALHSAGTYNDDAYAAHLSGRVIIVTPDDADRVIEEIIEKQERQVAQDIAGTIHDAVARIEALHPKARLAQELTQALQKAGRALAMAL